MRRYFKPGLRGNRHWRRESNMEVLVGSLSQTDGLLRRAGGWVGGRARGLNPSNQVLKDQWKGGNLGDMATP